MVEREFAGRETPATILTGVFVAGEDVPPIEFYLVSWQTVVEQQADNPRDGDVEIYGRNPVAAIRLEIALEFAYLAPVLEIVV